MVLSKGNSSELHSSRLPNSLHTHPCIYDLCFCDTFTLCVCILRRGVQLYTVTHIAHCRCAFFNFREQKFENRSKIDQFYCNS